MNALSSAEYARLHSTQESAMFDTCVPMTRTAGATDRYGKPVVAWTDGTALDCGLELIQAPEQNNAEATWFDAYLRLPSGTSIGNADRVRVTYRFGVVLASPLVFDIVGAPMPGPSALVLRLMSVPNG